MLSRYMKGKVSTYNTNPEEGSEHEVRDKVGGADVALEVGHGTDGPRRSSMYEEDCRGSSHDGTGGKSHDGLLFLVVVVGGHCRIVR